MLSRNFCARLTLFLVLLACAPASLWAQSQPAGAAPDEPGPVEFASPEDVHNRLHEDAQVKDSVVDADLTAAVRDWKQSLYEDVGFRFGADYNALFAGATDSLGDSTAASGAFRLYGSWELVGRGTPDVGGVNFKVEHRHAYTDVAPAALDTEIGQVGDVGGLVFSDQGLRTTTLYWRQKFAGGQGVAYVGFLDVTDYVDVYGLASPWTGFLNQAFSNGSGTIGGLPDGALGAMVGGWLADDIYLVGGIADANGDPTEFYRGFETLFRDFETFKSVEIGWAPDEEQVFLDHLHVTLWQLDARHDADTPSGWGVHLSASTQIDEHWLAFLRGGWADRGGSAFEGAVSLGASYTLSSGGDQVGAAINWGRPNRDTYGEALNDQFTGELFYRLQLTQNVQVTPGAQLLIHPALNPSADAIALFTLRARVNF